MGKICNTVAMKAMNSYPSSLTPNLRKKVLVGSMIGILLMILTFLFSTDLSNWWAIKRGVTSAIVLSINIFWLPFVMFLLSFKHYAISIAQNRKLNFAKSLARGLFVVFIVIVINIFIMFSLSFLYGPSNHGEIFGLLFLLIGGLIFQLIITTIFYLKSSRKLMGV